MFGAGRGQSPQAPIVPEPPSPEILPFAWYHPDTIQHTAGTVTGWKDVSGWNRHMTAGTNRPVDLERAVTVDGKMGVNVPAGGGVTNILETDVFDWVAFPYGFTLFMVANSPAPDGADPVVTFFAVSLLEFAWADGSEQLILSTGGDLAGMDARVAGPSAVGAYAYWDGLTVGMDVAGTPWVGDPVTNDDPLGQQWVGFTQRLQVELGNQEDAWVSEIILLPAGMGADARRRWWLYLAEQYPSIF
jgi:hypothetical protein